MLQSDDRNTVSHPLPARSRHLHRSRRESMIIAESVDSRGQGSKLIKMDTMRQLAISTLACCMVAGSLLAPTTALRAEDSSPCGQISAACVAAGFTPDGINTGTELLVHRVNPILQGTVQSREARPPLPHIDAELIATCKASVAYSGAGAGDREAARA
jgi:hypothetical protein